MVECNLAKVDVEGSNPFSRSEKPNENSRLEPEVQPVFSFEYHSRSLSTTLSTTCDPLRVVWCLAGVPVLSTTPGCLSTT